MPEYLLWAVRPPESQHCEKRAVCLEPPATEYKLASLPLPEKPHSTLLTLLTLLCEPLVKRGFLPGQDLTTAST